ncbi:MAG: septal ring lytic transglycosylase RlpA family protein [Sulfurovaceae bacterium]|jgi:rare lipoprotein A|nr:septal ring lytic transglycosylase RlpA family protein [Sulfurovaceae bacterium]
MKTKFSLQILSICLTIASAMAMPSDVNVTNIENNITKQYKHIASGKCSWYGSKFNGSRTASGERFDSTQKTAAHKTLPFGTLLRVTSTKTDKSVIVKVTDRGPFVKHRVLDISHAAAKELGVVGNGVFYAKIEVVK